MCAWLAQRPTVARESQVSQEGYGGEKEKSLFTYQVLLQSEH